MSVSPSSSSSSFSFSQDSPFAYELTPFQNDGTYAASILFVQNQFKRHDVEDFYQYIREVTSPLPLPELEILRANATDMKVQYHRLDAGNIHITIHWCEHLSFHWENVVYASEAIVPTKRQRSPYAIVVRIGDEELPASYGGELPIMIPSLKAILFARILQMCENGMAHEAFRYHDLFDHELEWLTLAPMYKCQLDQTNEGEKGK